MSSFISTENVIYHSPSPSTTFKTSKSHNQLISSIIKSNPLPQNSVTIRQYTLLKELGKGAFATVFLAYDNNTQDIVAIKVIDKFFLSRHKKTNEALIERIILAGCDNKRIIKLISAFQSKYKLYFVLEYALNNTLQDLIDNCFPLPYQVAKFYARELANVIFYLHNEKNIIHRDIKPNNILLDEFYGIKLIDFAFSVKENMEFNMKSKRFELCKENKINEYEDIVGTCEYVAPEMINKTNMKSKSNDIWAFGCILYQIFHGVTPFKGMCQSSTLSKIKKGEFHINSNLPMDLQDLIKKCLNLDIEQRIDINGILNHSFFKKNNERTNEINENSIINFIENDKKLSSYFNILTRNTIYFEHNEASTMEEEDETESDQFENKSYIKIKTSEYEVENYAHTIEISNDIIEDYYYSDSSLKNESEKSNILYSGLIEIERRIFGKKKFHNMILYKEGRLEIYENLAKKRKIFFYIENFGAKNCRCSLDKNINNVTIFYNEKKVVFYSVKSELEKWYKCLREINRYSL